MATAFRADMSKTGLYLIATLLLSLSALLLLSAAPSKRVASAAIAFGLVVVAAATARRAARLPRLTGSTARPLAHIIPHPKAFLRDLPELTTRFREWAAPRGAPLDDAPALLGWLRELEEDLHDPAVGLLLPAIAVYGELVRAELRGEWTQSRTLPGGELVVARRGRPWTRRRVLYEVLDALSA